MKIEFQCPYCNENLDADIDQESEVNCPACSKIFTVPVSMIEQQITDNQLLDPTDPAGYLNNFPMEDDFF